MDLFLREWSGEFTVCRYDEATSAYLFVAVHSIRLGPAAGGTRIKSYPSAADALRDAGRLAEAMTLKMAVAGLPMGGGKSVLAVPDPAMLDADARRHLLATHARTIEALRGTYWTGPDVGTTSADMDVLRESTRFAFGASPAYGGSGSSAPDTAVGVFAGIAATLRYLDGTESLPGRRVLVQGVGAVGGDLVRLLVAAGAHVIVSDLVFERVERLYDELDVEVVAPASVLEVLCDVIAPCAMGGVLTPGTIARLRCRVVAGAANNPLSSAVDAELLRERDILYAPDFVINAGGAIHLIGYETLHWSPEQVAAAVHAIGDTLVEIYERAAKEHVSTEVAAEQLAYARLGGA